MIDIAKLLAVLMGERIITPKLKSEFKNVDPGQGEFITQDRNSSIDELSKFDLDKT